MNFKNYRIVSLSVPKGLVSSPMLFESLLAYLHSLSMGTILEYVIDANVIQLLVHVPANSYDYFCAHLYSVYPECTLREITYLESIKFKSKKFLSINFCLKNSCIYPIKRYEQFEDKLTKIVFDPVNSVFEFLNSTSVGQVRISLFLRPEKQSFRFYANKALFILNKFEFYFAFGFLKKLFLITFLSRNIFLKLLFFPLLMIDIDNRYAVEDEVKKDHKIETSNEAAADKVNKTLFTASLKILVCHDSKFKINQFVNSAISFLKVFEQANLNGFKLKNVFCGDFKVLKKYFTFKDSFILNSEEVATIFHAPSENVNSNLYSWVESKKLPTPITCGELKLGCSDFRSSTESINLSVNDRLRHSYIIGKTGMGKSTLMLNMILQDAVLGNGFALIDPHGDLIDSFLSRVDSSRINNVILIEPFNNKYSIGLNLLESFDGVDNCLIVSSVLSIFKKLFGYSWGPRLEYILRNFILAAVCSKQGYTLLDLHRMFIDIDFCKSVVGNLKDTELIRFFEKEYFNLSKTQQAEFIAPILNKIGQFTLNPKIKNIISVKKSKIDLGLCMTNKQIVLINLSKGKLGEDSSSLLGSMYVSKFEIEILKRAKLNTNLRTPFYLYIDEFQNFATDSFSSILSEARKYGLGLILANQFLAQIPEEVTKSIFGNIGNLISFQVGAEDADFLSKQFLEQVLPMDILKLEKFHAYSRILVDGQPSSTFSFQTLLPPPCNSTFIRNTELIRQQNKSRFAHKNFKY